jgi:UDP-N-acetylenolpyruvoylglucosamine reductase
MDQADRLKWLGVGAVNKKSPFFFLGNGSNIVLMTKDTTPLFCKLGILSRPAVVRPDSIQISVSAG